MARRARARAISPRSGANASGGVLVSGENLARADPNELASRRAVALDDAAQAPERALLHLYNCCSEAGAASGGGARGPASWPIALPDSPRGWRAAPSVAIAPPDDRCSPPCWSSCSLTARCGLRPASSASLAPDGTLLRGGRRACRAARPALPRDGARSASPSPARCWQSPRRPINRVARGWASFRPASSGSALTPSVYRHSTLQDV